MIVLVCGGRYYDNYLRVINILSTFKIDLIIEGGATGADSLARQYAKENNIQCKTYNADWNKYGKGAGPIRNQQMIDENQIDCVIAFSGGKGTADMICRAKQAKIKVGIVK